MNAVIPLREYDGYPTTQAPRLPPHNIDAEQAVLGTLLMNNKIWPDISSLLKPEYFFEELHIRIYELCAKMIQGGKTANPVTIKTFLGEHDLGGVTTGQYLARLAVEAAPASDAVSYARLISDLHARRLMIAAGEDLLSAAHDAPVDASPASVASGTITTLQEVARAGADDSQRVDAASSALAMLDRIETDRAAGIKREFNSTGFAEIDRVTGGYEEGLLWIIGARPSMGKTTFMVSSASRAAMKAGREAAGGCGALCFSLEDDEQQATARILAHAAWSQRTAIEYNRIYRQQIEAGEEMRLREVADRLRAAPLVFDYKSGPTVDQIAHRVRTEKDRMARRGHRLGVVFVDFLTKIKASSAKHSQNRNYELGAISSALKDLAREEKICVVVFSQLNRATEQQNDKRPNLSNLRDSGELEQDANVVAFLHREAYYIERSPEFRQNDPDAIDELVKQKTVCEFIVAKNKSGPIKTVNLFCDMGASFMDGMSTLEGRA